MATNGTSDTTDTTAKRSNKREGPSPSHILLAAIIEALEADVDRGEITTAVKFADAATGVDQAPMWRTVSNMLTTAAEKATAKAAEAAKDAK